VSQGGKDIGCPIEPPAATKVAAGGSNTASRTSWLLWE